MYLRNLFLKIGAVVVVPITTDVVGSTPAQGEEYKIMW